MKKKEELPDHLRCNRNDGRQWRCNRQVEDGKKLCHIHYVQGRHRQHRQKVPDSLKLERKPNKPRNQETRSQNLQIQETSENEIRANGSQNQEVRPKGSLKNQESRVKKPQNQETRAKRAESQENGAKGAQNQENGENEKMVKRKRPMVEETLAQTLKRIKSKRGDDQLEVIRGFLQKQVEKKKRKELEEKEKEEEVEDLMRELPNGLMEITPTLSPQELGNAAPYSVKLGLNYCSVQQRRFRSKNVEPVPISTIQVGFFILFVCVSFKLKLCY